MVTSSFLSQRGSTPGFNPGRLANLAAWYAADKLVLNNNDPVGTWADASPNARDMSQATAGFKPLYIASAIGSKPSVRFDGVDDYLGSSGLGAALAGNDVVYSWSMVLKLAATTSGSTMFSLGSSSNATPYTQYQVAAGPSWRALRRDDASSTVTPGAVGTADTSAHVLTQVLQSGTQEQFFVDGTGLTAAGFDVGQSTFDHAAIGAFWRTTPASFASMDVAELVVVKAALSSDERRELEHYLGTKYGITVA